MSSSRVHTGLEAWRRLWQLAVVVFMLPGVPLALAANPPGAASAQASGAVPARLVVGTLAGGWAPFEAVADGRLSGLSVDYLRALVGPDVVLVPRTFPDMPQLLAAAAAGQVDLLMSIARTPEREHSLSFTAPYFWATTSVVVKAADNTVTEVTQLANARLAVEKGFALERTLRGRFPRAQIAAFADRASALRAVAQGHADAYLGFTPAVQYVLASEEFRGLRIAFEESGRPSELRFAVPRERAALRDQLDRALAAMNPADEAAIRARWLDANFFSPPIYTARRLMLSPAEQAWLRSLPPVAVGFDSGWPPFSYLDAGGRPSGMAAEYLDYLSRALGIRFAHAPLADWPATLGAFQHGDLAVLATAARGDPRLKNAVNTRPYVRHPLVMVGRESEPAARSLNDFATRRIAVSAHVAGSVPFAAYNIPPANVTVVPNLEEAFKLVALGKADVLVGNAAAVDIELKRHYEGELKILGMLGASASLGFAVHSDLAPLAGLIDRALTAMPPAEKQRIRQKWVSGNGGGHGAWSVSAVRLLPLLICIGAVLVVTLRAYLLLQREVRLRKQTARELARARDLAEAASRAKDSFLAMMSHEIRTPMNGVLGLVEVLERTRLNADQGEMLGMIHESAGALLQILDDLLDYSKIEAGRLTIEAEPIDLRELVDNAVGLLAGRAHEKGLKVRVDIAPEVAASLRGDCVRLRQILFNLLGNAIKFTPAGEVGVRVCVVGQTQHTQTLEISVEDTGIGIEPKVQARLFEPFVQAESSTTRRFGGTGLGLTICRKLIVLMGGALELQSTPGMGTRMTVRLVMPLEAQHYKVSGLHGKRGLVAVPDTRVAQALVDFGQALGMELRQVGEGAAELSDPAVLADMDLVLLGEGLALPGAARLGPRVIYVTEKPKPTGYRILDDTVRLSINPISWRGLGAACAAALTGLSTPASHARGIAEQSEAPPDRERAIASGRLILVAEDHPVNQELIRHQLALLGFACDVVNDGVEALAALQATRYGCLITDCHMPNLSGYELARRVREAEQAQEGGAGRLPILAITANTAPEDLSQCRAAGMDDCLVKPTRLATLREHLGRWFGADGARQGAPVEAVSAAGSAGPVVSPQGQESIESFVPVDLGHMTQLWGSESTVKALLDSFVTSVRDDVRALPALLDHADVAQLREWHHRMLGAAGVLRYPPLLAVLEQYRRGIAVKTPEVLRAEGLALVRKCNAMLDGIEEQAALLA